MTSTSLAKPSNFVLLTRGKNFLNLGVARGSSSEAPRREEDMVSDGTDRQWRLEYCEGANVAATRS